MIDLVFSKRNQFNYSLDDLPTNLELGNAYNLPASLLNLECCGMFNQPINNLSRNLIYLTSSYNKPLINLPNSLKIIEFPYNNKFTYDLSKSFNIKFLMYYESSQSIKNLLPFITHLEIWLFF